MTKILFELQLGISRITNFVETFNIGALMVAVVTKYVEFAIKSNREVNLLDSTKYENFGILMSIDEINTLSMAFCSIFFPFRIIQMLAHFPILGVGKTVINTMCRTAPGLAVYAVAIIVLFLSWAMGMHILLAPFYIEFEHYSSTIYTMLCSDFQAIQQKYAVQDGFNRNHTLIEYCQLFLYLMKTILAMFGVALCVNLYK